MSRRRSGRKAAEPRCEAAARSVLDIVEHGAKMGNAERAIKWLLSAHTVPSGDDKE
jgi:hypothetical protein